VLLLGQHATLDVFKDRCLKLLPKGTQLRKNPHQWPPLHTPIVRHKFISNKAALLLEQTSGGFIKPSPPILSCVTGDYSYTELNCREIFVRWTESPQRLWQALHKLLEENCEIMIHLGPEPNIIPATMSRLSANVSSYMNPATWTGYGIQTLSQNSASRRWLAKLISIDSAVLRTPFVQQVVLEDEFSTQGS
jgi:[acyl-carrier-protein] S-malonyltransferase